MFLPWREIAEGDVDVGIDQAGDCRHAAGIDHHVGAIDRSGRGGTDQRDALTVTDDGVTGSERRMPIAGNDLTEIDDRDLHRPGPQVRPSKLSQLR